MALFLAMIQEGDKLEHFRTLNKVPRRDSLDEISSICQKRRAGVKWPFNHQSRFQTSIRSFSQLTIKFRSCPSIALNFIYFCVSFSPKKSLWFVSGSTQRSSNLARVSYSLLSRVNCTIVRARRDFYERCLKVRRTPFRRHKELRCSPRTKELSYVSRETVSVLERVYVFQAGIFS